MAVGGRTAVLVKSLVAIAPCAALNGVGAWSYLLGDVGELVLVFVCWSRGGDLGGLFGCDFDSDGGRS